VPFRLAHIDLAEDAHRAYDEILTAIGEDI
jgi:hypothetical protein